MLTTQTSSDRRPPTLDDARAALSHLHAKGLSRADREVAHQTVDVYTDYLKRYAADNKSRVRDTLHRKPGKITGFIGGTASLAVLATLIGVSVGAPAVLGAAASAPCIFGIFAGCLLLSAIVTAVVTHNARKPKTADEQSHIHKLRDEKQNYINQGQELKQSIASLPHLKDRWALRGVKRRAGKIVPDKEHTKRMDLKLGVGWTVAGVFVLPLTLMTIMGGGGPITFR